jgi:hypothetical protein
VQGEKEGIEAQLELRSQQLLACKEQLKTLTAYHASLLQRIDSSGKAATSGHADKPGLGGRPSDTFLKSFPIQPETSFAWDEGCPSDTAAGAATRLPGSSPGMLQAPGALETISASVPLPEPGTFSSNISKGQGGLLGGIYHSHVVPARHLSDMSYSVAVTYRSLLDAACAFSQPTASASSSSGAAQQAGDARGALGIRVRPFGKFAP